MIANYTVRFFSFRTLEVSHWKQILSPSNEKKGAKKQRQMEKAAASAVISSAAPVLFSYVLKEKNALYNAWLVSQLEPCIPTRGARKRHCMAIQNSSPRLQ